MASTAQPAYNGPAHEHSQPTNALNSFLSMLRRCDTSWHVLPCARGEAAAVSMPVLVATARNAEVARELSRCCSTQSFASVKNACTRLLRHARTRLPKALSPRRLSGDKDQGMKMLLKVRLIGPAGGALRYERANPSGVQDSGVLPAIVLPMFGMPFCALQRNKHTRRKDAALRQDEEIFALVRWLRGLLELSVAELPTVVGGHEAPWCQRTLACLASMRASVGKARDCVSGHEDLFLMSELWLQNLVDHGFLLQHADAALAARQPALPQQSSLQLLAAQTLQQQRQQVTAYHPGMHPGQGMPLPYHGLGMPAAPWRQTGFNPTAMYPAQAPHGQAAPVASHPPTHAAGAPGQVSAWHPPPPAAPRPYTATGSSLHDTEISDLVTAWHGHAGSAASNPLTKALAYVAPPAAPSSASTSGTELKQAPLRKVPPITAFEGAAGGAAAGSKVATPPIGAQAVTFFGE